MCIQEKGARSRLVLPYTHVSCSSSLLTLELGSLPGWALELVLGTCSTFPQSTSDLDYIVTQGWGGEVGQN